MSDLSSSITLWQPKGVDAEGMPLTCLKPRSTEVQALRFNPTNPEDLLSGFERKLLHLERVGMNPRGYPDVEDKPRQALGGTALYQWIAARCGTTPRPNWRDVEAWLTQIGAALDSA